MSEFL